MDISHNENENKSRISKNSSTRGSNPLQERKQDFMALDVLNNSPSKANMNDQGHEQSHEAQATNKVAGGFDNSRQNNIDDTSQSASKNHVPVQSLNAEPRHTAGFRDLEYENQKRLDLSNNKAQELNIISEIDRSRMDQTQEYLGDITANDDDYSLDESMTKPCLNNPFGQDRSFANDKSYYRNDVSRSRLGYSDTSHLTHNAPYVDLGYKVTGDADDDLKFNFDASRSFIMPQTELQMNNIDEHALSQLTEDTQDLSYMTRMDFKNNLYNQDNSMNLDMSALERSNISGIHNRSQIHNKTMDKSRSGNADALNVSKRNVSQLAAAKESNSILEDLGPDPDRSYSDLSKSTDQMISGPPPILRNNFYQQEPTREVFTGVPVENEDCSQPRMTAAFGIVVPEPTQATNIERVPDFGQNKVSKSFTYDEKKHGQGINDNANRLNISDITGSSKRPAIAGTDPTKIQVDKLMINQQGEQSIPTTERINQPNNTCEDPNDNSYLGPPGFKFSQLDISKISAFEVNQDNDEFIGNVTANNVNAFLSTSYIRPGQRDSEKKERKSNDSNPDLTLEFDNDYKKSYLKSLDNLENPQITEAPAETEETQLADTSRFKTLNEDVQTQGEFEGRGQRVASPRRHQLTVKTSSPVKLQTDSRGAASFIVDNSNKGGAPQPLLNKTIDNLPTKHVTLETMTPYGQTIDNRPVLQTNPENVLKNSSQDDLAHTGNLNPFANKSYDFIASTKPQISNININKSFGDAGTTVPTQPFAEKINLIPTRSPETTQSFKSEAQKSGVQFMLVGNDVIKRLEDLNAQIEERISSGSPRNPTEQIQEQERFTFVGNQNERNKILNDLINSQNPRREQGNLSFDEIERQNYTGPNHNPAHDASTGSVSKSLHITMSPRSPKYVPEVLMEAAAEDEISSNEGTPSFNKDFLENKAIDELVGKGECLSQRASEKDGDAVRSIDDDVFSRSYDYQGPSQLEREKARNTLNWSVVESRPHDASGNIPSHAQAEVDPVKESATGKFEATKNLSAYSTQYNVAANNRTYDMIPSSNVKDQKYSANKSFEANFGSLAQPEIVLEANSVQKSTLR